MTGVQTCALPIFTNIDTYVEKLEKLYIVDNSDTINEEIISKIKKKYNNIEYIQLGENLGIAKALNIGLEKFIISDSNLFLTMDQDSKFNKNNLELFFNKILEENDHKIGIFSPRHKTSANNFLIKEDLFVDKVMASGNILTKDLVISIGGFNEEFFIDEVDHEYCFRARRKNYKIKLYGDIYLNHNLGDMNKKNKLPKFLISTHHNKIRRYYITRNKLYMIEMYPELKIKYTITFFNDLLKILLYEKNKFDKLKMIRKGYYDYKNKVMGKYRE